MVEALWVVKRIVLGEPWKGKDEGICSYTLYLLALLI